ncbi:MAG: hybrid sensor histidine kinase/response regulator [Proteobacteria bacterium]|nr:hybrid sensor histidine kinase/response regulator [Pseudomonadota bacterium]
MNFTPAETRAVDEHHRNEKAQAIVRVSVATIAFVYINAANLFFDLGKDIYIKTASLFFCIIIFSSVILYIVTKFPKKSHIRLGFTMIHDYSAITYTMFYGGEKFLILYAILLWATVGNGIRFGTRYLLVAAIAALTSIAVNYLFNPYWRDHPFVTLTLTVTTIIVPAYIQVLILQRRLATEAAQAANIAKSKLLAQASHDLRQPIHAISLFTASLREAGLGKREADMVENIDRSLHSVSRLFRSLLDVSSLDSGAIQPRIEAVALGPLLADIVARNQKAAEWAGVELRLVKTRLTVLSDPSLLATMVQNLVSNALKYAPGRPVLVGCRRRGGRLSIEVHDCGKGIPKEHLPRIFDDFYRAIDRGHDIDGVGLGLSIVKRMAERLDLKVSVRSRPGSGTSMAIDGLGLTAAISGAHREAAPRIQTPLTGLRVLLVDDDEAVLRATTDLLQRWGCVVQPSRHLPADVAPCDFVITDFDLNSDATGADCIAAARRGGQKPAVIVLTGHDASRVRDQIPGGEDVPVLMKPVRPAELRSVMVSLVLARANRQMPASAPLTAAAARVDTPNNRSNAET